MSVEIYCVPGHMGVEGNEKADEKAKDAAERSGTRRFPERFASLAHVNCTITERKWKEAKHSFKMENNMRPPLQRARYDPALESQGPDIEAMMEPAYVSR